MKKYAKSDSSEIIQKLEKLEYSQFYNYTPNHKRELEKKLLRFN